MNRAFSDFAISITFGEAAAKVLVIQIVTSHTRFRGIALVNALKPRRSVKISSPKMTMNEVILARAGSCRLVPR
jgi:hypothetical protein